MGKILKIWIFREIRKVIFDDFLWISYGFLASKRRLERVPKWSQNGAKNGAQMEPKLSLFGIPKQ